MTGFVGDTKVISYDFLTFVRHSEPKLPQQVCSEVDRFITDQPIGGWSVFQKSSRIVHFRPDERVNQTHGAVAS
jgi:hypothetical protein